MRITDTKAAQSELIAALRKHPDDVNARLQLFRFAVIDGNWDRAGTQLDAAESLDASLAHTAMVYRRNIACERRRASVFTMGEAPVFLGEPPAWAGYLAQALMRTGEDGAELAMAALEEAQAVGGTINGQSFAWLADADNRLGPMLEAFIDGHYYWVPFEHLAGIAIQPPDDLLDLAWCPCELTLSNGGSCNAYIPTRYPATDGTQRDELKLARLTEWQAWAGDMQKGLGQRVFVTDRDEYALLDCRDIRFDVRFAPGGALLS